MNRQAKTYRTILLSALILCLAAPVATARVPGDERPLSLAPGQAEPDAIETIRAILSDLHVAASKADIERYLRHLAPDAVCYGTDSSERWTVEELRAVAEPYFDQGLGWTTVPSEQNVYLSEDGTLAWFDERLRSSRWGEMRGTGVLRRLDEGWRIVQYNTAFPVPNELVPDMVPLIAAVPAKPRSEGPPAPESAAVDAVRAVLDDFHLAASEADGERFFGHLASDAISYGTDSSERWTVDALRALAGPLFANGVGWTTLPTEPQNVYLSENGTLAWFDERLKSSRWGEMRGSGVLRLTDGHWKIVQYNRVFPVPNELVEDMAKRIQELHGQE